MKWGSKSSLLAFAVIAGCATPSPANQSSTAKVASVNELDAQELAPGDCGLFLWTAGEPRRFVFFSKAGSETANVNLGDDTVSMTAVSSEGDLFGQFMTEMRFQSAEPRSQLDVSLTPGELLEQGQRIEDARLTLTDAEGWETIIPVLGVRACQVE